MVNGPEHYAKAEQLLAEVDRTPHGAEDVALTFARAQVHATLATAVISYDARLLDAHNTLVDELDELRAAVRDLVAVWDDPTSTASTAAAARHRLRRLVAGAS